MRYQQFLRQQLAGFENEAEIYDVGTVLQVGDGIARVYGLSKVMVSELVEFPNNVMGWYLTLMKIALVVCFLVNLS